MAETREQFMKRMDHRLNTQHQRTGNAGSRVVIRKRRGRAISPKVEADKFRPVARVQPASIALLGVRVGTVTPAMVGATRAAYSTIRPRRGEPQARIPDLRDRRPIAGANTPAAHPAIGRARHSILLLIGGSDLDG